MHLSRADGGPAHLELDPSTGEIIKALYAVDGRLHREGDEPASFIEEHGQETHSYYVDGELHRDEGPAVEEFDTTTGRCVRRQYWIKGRWKFDDPISLDHDLG